ncbi:reverse transcriptase domain-containing protein [Tanacetum coccineum]
MEIEEMEIEEMVEMEMNKMEMEEMEMEEMEMMKTIFHISNCPEKYQVKYASCTLLNSALTWWNSHKRIFGIEAAYAMSWAKLKKLMTKVYCLRNKVQNIETELWNLAVKGNDLTAYTRRF